MQYQRSTDFDEAGVWGVLHVLAGRLTCVVEPPLAREVLVETGHRR